ncbi:MAG: hypothetical protein AB8F78_13475 [Saprospiraceae bacterium]
MLFRLTLLLISFLQLISSNINAQIHPDFVAEVPYLPKVIQSGVLIPDSVAYFNMASNLVDTNVRVIKVLDYTPGSTALLTVTNFVNSYANDIYYAGQRDEYQLVGNTLGNVKRFLYRRPTQDYVLEADTTYALINGQLHTTYETFDVAINPASSGYLVDTFDISPTFYSKYQFNFDEATQQLIFPGKSRQTFSYDQQGELRFSSGAKNIGGSNWEDTTSTTINYDTLADGRFFYHDIERQIGSPISPLITIESYITYGTSSDTLRTVEWTRAGIGLDSFRFVNEYDQLGRRVRTTRSHNKYSTTDRISVQDFVYFPGRLDSSFLSQTITFFNNDVPVYKEGIHWHYPKIPIQYLVGPTGDFTTPRALSDANVLEPGDTVTFQSATYRAEDALAKWEADDLVLQAEDASINLFADNTALEGKAIWVITGDNVSVDGIIFHDATVPDQNGAGIRLEGNGLKVRNCGFYNNENGILTNNTNAGHIDISSSIFGQNGEGDGQSHNLYIGYNDSLTFVGNYSFGANVGHQLKSRAQVNFIAANRFSDEQTGNASRLIDLPNGGQSTIIGNVFHQGPNAPNGNFVGYGLEGLSNDGPHEFVSIHNTMVNERSPGGTFYHLATGTTSAVAINNLLVGGSSLVNGSFTEETGNVLIPSISAAGFENAQQYNFKLTSASPAINAGANASETNWIWEYPALSYEHPAMSVNRLIDVRPDAGAHEVGGISSTVTAFAKTSFLVSNLVTDNLQLNDQSSGDYRIESITGQTLARGQVHSSSIDVSNLSTGMYVLMLSGKGSEVFLKR